MNRNEVKRRLHSLIGLESLHSWDVDEHIDYIATLPAETQEEIFRQIMAIWPVSYALSFAFLDQLPKGLACLHHNQLSTWVNAALDVYEIDGLQASSRFLADVEKSFACKLTGKSSLSLEQAKGRLQPYITGLAGYEISLDTNPTPYTDTTTIYLEPEISLFKRNEENFLLYKLTLSMQWALLTSGLYRLQTGADDPLIEALCKRYQKQWPQHQSWLQNFFDLFPQPELAADLFLLAETVRATSFLEKELPGLIRDAAPLRRQLLNMRPDSTSLAGKNKICEGLKQWVLAGNVNGKWQEREEDILRRTIQKLQAQQSPTASPVHSARIAADLYTALSPLSETYRRTAPIAYVGILQPELAEQARQRRREEAKTEFIAALAVIMPQGRTGNDQGMTDEPSGQPSQQSAENEAGIIQPGRRNEEPQQPPADTDQPQTYITIDDQRLQLPESLQPLLREIHNDLGHIPQQYISSASQRAGSGIGHGPGPQSDETTEINSNGRSYDEWDFRRAGFRKNWCTLLEKELQPVKGTFIDETMNKYRGELRRLRRQFEMMRSQQRFVKRQRDGDDIDLDAVIEAHSDLMAGHPPSERLYIRLLRDQRNINAVFLVDMSSSTEGWIGTAIKEALVLMCESLSVLGDSYAIYGFSGMRRSRSELYHIKHQDEPYGETVRGRITAITPKDYTRMGPPIRHLSKLLNESDGGIKLLITLSDGKPEDYDAYKGDYAIEDTRHALIEAKNCGIHPFCITVDRKAQDYISHMYGEVNYILIDEVSKLPCRMPQIYRNLTT